jgi:myo-inositol 2-dehydrogenase/D-chiro-inositol 1-dehydrogenase
MAQADNNYEDSHRLYTGKGIQGSLPLHFFLERYAAAYKSEMASYVTSLKNGDTMEVDGTDGLRSLQIGLAAIKSLREKRPVKIEEIGN